MKRFKMIYSLFFLLMLVATSCQESEMEGAEGTEGQGGEIGESGQQWDRSATANEIINGVNLILTYDATSESFKGTLENLNTKVAPQVRVEVHVYDAAGNSTEYGPTTPKDMQAGEKHNVVLATPGAGSFVTFAMHPEVGGSGSEAGEGSGGESGESAGHESGGN
ncbi:hypothetical protein EYV94_27300 [Puteibacter caeruleilacunae]|nr:hypothetical protein EYV94_27300 [Puteibacter caeruleilacunae]